MKRSLLFVLTAVILISSCSKSGSLISDPDKLKKSLAGYWLYDMQIGEKSVIPIVHLFSEDGNYTVANFLGGTIEKSIWKIDKNHLLILNKENSKESYEIAIEKITENSMTVFFPKENERQVWKKGGAKP